jgi:hypothetical protein
MQEELCKLLSNTYQLIFQRDQEDAWWRLYHFIHFISILFSSSREKWRNWSRGRMCRGVFRVNNERPWMTKEMLAVGWDDWSRFDKPKKEGLGLSEVVHSPAAGNERKIAWNQGVTKNALLCTDEGSLIEQPFEWQISCWRWVKMNQKRY